MKLQILYLLIIRFFTMVYFSIKKPFLEQNQERFTYKKYILSLNLTDTSGEIFGIAFSSLYFEFPYVRLNMEIMQHYIWSWTFPP